MVSSELESVAIDQVKAIEDQISKDLAVKSFDTTYATTFVQPPPNRPSYLKKHPEWQPRDHEAHVTFRPSKDIHYSYAPAVTFAGEALGVAQFHRQTTFSHPLELARKGGMYKDESGSRCEVPVGPTGDMHSLPALRKSLRDRINLTLLKSRLAGSTENGMVSTVDVTEALEEQCQGWAWLPRYLTYVETQLATMRRGFVRLDDIVKDLTPL